MGVLGEAVIGLVFVYLLVSLICTIINELIASVLQLRALQLRSGIEKIIDDPNLQRAFFGSGIFRMAGKASGTKGPSYLPSKTFALALLDALDGSGRSETKQTMDDIAGAIDKLPTSDVKIAWEALLQQAEGSVESARTVIAGWFDEMMNRLTGIYKRNLQALSLLIAALLCIILNVDSLQISRAVWFDDSLRESLASSATDFIKANPHSDQSANNFQKIEAQLRPVPLGWDFSPDAAQQVIPSGTTGWMEKVIGLTLSALAVSLGAPFWFDLLNKFVSIRGTGPAPSIEKD